MAKANEDSKKPDKSKKTVTMRDRVSGSKENKPKKRRLRQTAAHIGRPIKAAKKAGQKEVYLPMPDNKAGRFLNKKRRVTPKFFVEAWRELKLVEWPNRKQTAKLTFAVLAFAIIFGVIIALVDFGLDKIFRSLLLK